MSNKSIEKLIEGLELSCKLIRTEISRLKKTLIPKPKVLSKLEGFDKNYNILMKGVPQSKKPSKVTPKIEANQSLEKLGREGEIAFQNYLHEILDPKYCSIKWMNQGYESKKPYDFEVTICGVIFYIDVKTTRGSQSTKYFISPQELKFVKEKLDNYMVARLSQFDDLRRYKADSFNVKMISHLDVIKSNK